MKKEIVKVLLAHIVATSIFTCGENAYNAFTEELPKSNSNEVQEYENFDVIDSREIYQVVYCNRNEENPDKSILICRKVFERENEVYTFDFEDLCEGDLVYKVSDSRFVCLGYVAEK
jgi:hypothetical protein